MEKKTKFIVGCVIISAALIIAAIIIATVVSNKITESQMMVTTNQRALELYDKASELIKAERLGIAYSSDADEAITEAQALDPKYVQDETKLKINALAEKISQLELLSSASEACYSEKQYDEAKDLLYLITLPEIIELDTYKDLKELIEFNEIRMANKSRTEADLVDLVNNHYDKITNSWSNSCSEFIAECGTARFAYPQGTNKNFSIELTNYNDETYCVNFKAGNEEDWNNGIAKIYDQLQVHTEIDISVIAGMLKEEQYYRAISYSLIKR